MISGVNANTANGFIIGPGALYKDFINPASPGTVIGATSGGNSVKYGLEFYDPPIDGLMGPLVDAKRLVGATAEINANLVEITKDNLMLALAGSVQTSFGSPATHTKITHSGAISAGNFISAIALVGERGGTNQPVCFVVKNALAADPVEVNLNDGKGTVVLKCRFVGHFLSASPSVVPWDIYSPL